MVWLIFRTGEGLIQFYNEPFYWKLINIAGQYSSVSGAEKKSLSDLARTLFKAKDYRFKFAMVCWSMGTLAFSIVLVTCGFVPVIIGWLGVAASLLVGFYTGIRLVNPNLKIPPIGALFAILFELIIGGWLLLHPH
jgi:hypothetical protein